MRYPNSCHAAGANNFKIILTANGCSVVPQPRMASSLTAQVRSIAQVARAVERGDPSQQITVKAKGTTNASTPSPRSPGPLTVPLVGCSTSTARFLNGPAR